MIIQGISLSERESFYPQWVDISLFNGSGVLKPSAFQRLFASCAERHLTKFGAGTDSLLCYNLAWALTSVSFETVTPIAECETLQMQTWCSQRKGPYFRRDFIFRSEDGTERFHGTSYSILLDVATRKVFRKKELPFEIDPPCELFTMEASPNFKTDATFEPVERRCVAPHSIDRLGHMNNVCYGDLAYDALTEEERKNLITLKRSDVYFVSEMRQGDEFTLERAVCEQQIIVRGKNETKGDIAFYYIFTF